MPSRVVYDVAIVDPDSLVPQNRLLVGYFVNGSRVSQREALAAHRRGANVTSRVLDSVHVEVSPRHN